MNEIDDILRALVPVRDAFDRLGVAYYVGGSVASTIYGAGRSTMDVDVVADLRPEHAAPLVAALGDAFYADEQSISEAIARRSSFNLVHLATSFKVDVFVAKLDAYHRESLRRRVPDTLSDSTDSPTFLFASKEDIVLAKLDWYRKGGGVSERQWLDVRRVLKSQARAMDFDYLRRWSAVLGVSDLFDRAVAEAGQP